mmetsp:Transcript_3309/g.3654  ORF Transcript_3309/g.3654 Transcript_3309/m.3654 type:complete len:126 (-) Transcript_3309:149-526(-)
MKHIEILFNDFKDRADFLCVYILEAHAQDEWPISSARFHDGEPVILNQQKTISERVETAKAFVKRYETEVPVVCDTMTNEFEKKYAPWPVRFYIVNNRKMAHIENPEGCTYYIGRVRKALESILD